MGSKTVPFRGCARFFFLSKTIVWQHYCAFVLRGCNCSAVLLLGSSHTTSLTLFQMIPNKLRTPLNSDGLGAASHVKFHVPSVPHHTRCTEESYSETSLVLISRYCLMYLHSNGVDNSNPVQILGLINFGSWSFLLCHFPHFLRVVRVSVFFSLPDRPTKEHKFAQNCAKMPMV